MFSDLPNFAMVFGYTNASWTLKADLTCEFVTRLLGHMKTHGYSYCVPRNHDPSMATEPFVDFSSGYFQRSLHLLPKQGARRPWRLNHNYLLDTLSLRRAPIEDGVLEFVPRRASERPAAEAAVAA
jgi:hypothetical protein